jgi:3-oxosteroid 1-dehydrogenase
MAKVGLRMLQNKLGRDLVGMGGAVQARLMEIALREGVPIFLSTPVTEYLTRDGAVVGVRVKQDGKLVDVACGSGVLLDCGGFSHNAELRQKYLPQPTSSEWTFSNPGDTGEMLKMTMDLGAAVDAMDQSWWNSISVYPNGTKGGHPLDLAKPHCIMVDQSGERYVNEATSYVTVGNAMYARHKVVPAVPSWFVSDQRHRMRYRWGGLPPGRPLEEWVKGGYIIVADTLDELAKRCSLDPAKLAATVQRFNQFAKAGVDKDFGRGGSAYNRFFGDPSNHPNPSLGTIEEGPFYAVKMYPGDVGTAGGLVTDEHARVLRTDGTSIPGLYATGNVTASVVGRSYPGAGASIGASLVFGYIAAKHALHVNS